MTMTLRTFLDAGGDLRDLVGDKVMMMWAEELDELLG
jgi:hypothetical protein